MTEKFEPLLSLNSQIQNVLDFMTDDFDLINEDKIYMKLQEARNMVLDRVVEEK